MALLLQANGISTEVKPKNGTDFQLEEIYTLLGIEVMEVVPVYGYPELLLVIDEEGKLKGPPYILNYAATLLYTGASVGAGRDVIIGNALLCRKNEMK